MMALPAAQAQQAGAAAAPARAVACAACHGPGGRSALANIPSLAGQPAVFTETQLIMIREGLRPVPQMQGLLDGVSDAEVTALAKYYSEQKPAAPEGERRPAQIERGQALATQLHCGSCHMAAFQGREQMPRLAGQREDYLAYSMKQFRDNKTSGRDTIMAATLHGVSDSDIAALAHFLAQFPSK